MQVLVTSRCAHVVTGSTSCAASVVQEREMGRVVEGGDWGGCRSLSRLGVHTWSRVQLPAPPRWSSGKGPATRARGSGIESRFKGRWGGWWKGGDWGGSRSLSRLGVHTWSRVQLPAPPRWSSGKGPATRARGSGIESPRFPRSSHTSDLNIGTQVSVLPGADRFGVSAKTG